MLVYQRVIWDPKINRSNGSNRSNTEPGFWLRGYLRGRDWQLVDGFSALGIRPLVTPHNGMSSCWGRWAQVLYHAGMPLAAWL